MALDRWAVVRPDSPEPIIPSSTTRTPRPASARRKAVVRPAIPEPITQTSTDSSSESGGYAGGCASIHGEMVPSDVIELESQAGDGFRVRAHSGPEPHMGDRA